MVLLPFVVLIEGANAQSDRAGVIGTIENTANAAWNTGGLERRAVSNTVTIDVTMPPPGIRTFRPAPGGGIELKYDAPICGLGGGGIASNQTGSTGGNIPLPPRTGSVELSNIVQAGQTVVFEITGFAANRDRNAVDELAITILARQQPVARDLRIVVSALRISASLERMGDIAQRFPRTSSTATIEPRRATAVPTSA